MISLISNDIGLEALSEEWGALWDRTPSATPFQSPRWLLPWWHQFGTGLPRVAIRQRQGHLTGVLPLYVLPNEGKALPMGVGPTDYHDILGDPEGLLEAGLAAIADEHIAACHLVDIQHGSTLIGASAPRWTSEWRESTACPVLAPQNITKRARRKLAMSRNRACRVGGWSVQTATFETIDDHLARLLHLHQKRWLVRGEPGAVADPRIKRFWREAAPGLVAAGLLRLQSLLIAGELVAVTAALLAPGRIFFYLSGFDESQAFCSPGTILLGAMLDDAFAEGRTEAHFLRGQESYKYVWGAQDRFNWSGSFVLEADHHR